MKTLSILALLIPVSFFSQSSNWTKDDRNNLYDDCINYTTKYRKVTGEQKESLCLCYLEDITKKYAKGDFEAKIDIEVKRIKEAVLTQCAKNIGVEFASTVKSTEQTEKPASTAKSDETKLSRDFLIGKWKADNNTTIEFKTDGTFVKSMHYRFVTSNYGHIEGNRTTGDWFLDENGTLTINEKWTEDIGARRVKLQNYFANGVYKFVSYTDNYIKYKYVNGAYAEDVANQLEREIIQANRIIE